MFKFNILLFTLFITILSGCSEHEIYLYKGTPCEGKVFTTSKDVILLHNEPHQAHKLEYGFSIYDLKDYAKYRHDRGITFREKIDKNYRTNNMYTKEIKLYPAGSSFKILEFYTQVSTTIENHMELSYYLVQSLEDNKTAWLYFFDFNPKECSMELYSGNKHYQENREYEALLRKTYQGISVDNDSVMPDDFSENEDLFAVSRRYQEDHAIQLLNSIKEHDKKDLYDRIRNNDFDRYYARWLKQNHVDINVRFQHNETPLILAVTLHNAQIVDNLLLLGADTTLKDDNGKTALDYADKEEFYAIYQSLKMHSAKQKAIKANGSTAVTITRFDKRTDTTTVKQINPIKEDKQTWSPLIIAISRHNNKQALQMIHEKQYLYDKTNNGSTPLFAAVIFNNRTALDALLSIGTDVNIENSYKLTPLYAAVIENNSYAVKQLLDHGADMYTNPKR